MGPGFFFLLEYEGQREESYSHHYPDSFSWASRDYWVTLTLRGGSGGAESTSGLLMAHSLARQLQIWETWFTLNSTPTNIYWIPTLCLASFHIISYLISYLMQPPSVLQMKNLWLPESGLGLTHQGKAEEELFSLKGSLWELLCFIRTWNFYTRA